MRVKQGITEYHAKLFALELRKRHYDGWAKQVEVQKDTLLDQVEERLQQQVSDQDLFTIKFLVI